MATTAAAPPQLPPRSPEASVAAWLDARLPTAAAWREAVHAALAEARTEHARTQDRLAQLEAAREDALLRPVRGQLADAAAALDRVDTARSGALAEFRAWLESVDEAAWAEIRTLCLSLRQSEAVLNYLTLLKQAETYSVAIASSASVPTREAQRIVNELTNICTVVDASPFRHFRATVNGYLAAARGKLQARLTEELNAALKTLQWPKPKAAVAREAFSPAALDAFRAAFKALLDLQNPLREYLSHGPDLAELTSTGGTASAYPPLLAMRILCEPLRKRFRFHFMGDRDTNQLDKPEWYLAHAVAMLRDHSLFLAEDVQPILNEAGLPMYSAKGEFARQMADIVSERLRADWPELMDLPELMIHTVHEALLFDRDLVRIHDLPPGAPGVAHFIMSNDDWAAHWLEAHRDLAERQVAEVVEAGDAFARHFGGVADDLVRTTVCAERSLALLRGMTDRYRWVALVHVRAAFFAQIHRASALQLADQLAARLPSADYWHRLDAEAHTTALRILSTASHLARQLAAWSDDIFYVALWQHRRARNEAGSQRRRANAGDSDEVDDDAHVEEGGEDDEEEDDAGAWEPAVAQLNAAAARARALLIDAAVADFVTALTPYLRRQPWSMPAPSVVPGQEAPDDADHVLPEWLELLAFVQHRLATIERELEPTDAETVAKELAAALDAQLMTRVVRANRFRHSGGRRVYTDFRLLYQLFRSYSQQPENLFKSSKEATLILQLPPADLRELVKELRQPSWTDSMEEEQVLAPLGVYRLSAPEALEIAERRRDREA